MSWETDHGITYISGTSGSPFTAIVTTEEDDDFSLDETPTKSSVRVCWVYASDLKSLRQRLKKYFEVDTPIGSWELLTVLPGFHTRADWNPKLGDSVL